MLLDVKSLSNTDDPAIERYFRRGAFSRPPLLTSDRFFRFLVSEATSRQRIWPVPPVLSSCFACFVSSFFGSHPAARFQLFPVLSVAPVSSAPSVLYPVAASAIPGTEDAGGWPPAPVTHRGPSLDGTSDVSLPHPPSGVLDAPGHLAVQLHLQV